eukprot:TRINITY_DN13683_c0_g1_i1.p1 TRINITY_DN13683_c0_g1~~TRINITY_DN13683_c0_g1_i1.p1  ORF type:complete len:185 (+),score=45.92 TRINITY_DN13683_c0_g1_i1:148-702(+)
MVHAYSKEEGVRQLQQAVHKICRKIALDRVQQKEKPSKKMKLTVKSLENYLGPPPLDFIPFENSVPGVCVSLGWTRDGGIPIFIESIKDSTISSPGIIVSGNLGPQVQDAIDVCYSFAMHYLKKIEPENKFFEKAYVHINFPSLYKPKEGRSAGLAVVTSLLSLALNKPVPQIAMTGEVTLTGN